MASSNGIEIPKIGVKNMCAICNTFVHSSNIKTKCCLCSVLVHRKFCLTGDGDFFCGRCLSENLPFVNVLEDEDFYNEIGIYNHSLKNRLNELTDLRFNLNPFSNLDNKFINSSDIDADENYFDCLTGQNLGYVDTDRLDESLSDGSNGSIGFHSIMHINARSLLANIDLLCANLNLLKNKFSIICVSEVWSCQSTERFISIPGYNCVCRSRSTGRGGGLALFFDSDLDIIIKDRPDLDSPDSIVYESLIVQISQSNKAAKDIIVGVLYRPPNTNIDTFLSNLSNLLDTLNKENRPTYLLGDYNIDLLKQNTHSESFLNLLLSSGFYPKIDRPTKVTNTTATLIDNILTNVHE